LLKKKHWTASAGKWLENECGRD